MADYIYLLQNRLTPAQWRAVESVREAARSQGMPVFLVGGAVRDLTSGSPVRDLDFAVQGEAERLVESLEAAGAVITGRNAVLSSIFLTFRGGVRAEIGPTLSVTYEKPGQSTAHPAAILDDLRRRDFTANAMAVSLNEGSYGLLLDPLNGTADIENREFRLVSPYGFIENPALLLRAARLSNRLGWLLEERTASRYATSKEEEHLKALPSADRGYELEEIFHEEDPTAAMEHLAAEGWLTQLSPALKPESADRNGIEGVRDAIGQMESNGIFPDPSAVYFPLLTSKLPEKDRASLKASFARQGFAQQIESIEQRAKELGSQLTAKAAALPSDAWRLLRAGEPDLVLWLTFHVRSGAVQTKIKAFLKDWPQMRQKLPYALMQEMRITPDLPEYDKLLDDLFFALIDGKLETPEATRAFLEPYSPPAPPQINLRKRPAKAARGRAKKVAVEETSPDQTEEADSLNEEAILEREIEDEDADEERDEAVAVAVSASDEPEESASEALEAEPVEDREDEPVSRAAASPAKGERPKAVASKKPAKKAAAPAATTAKKTTVVKTAAKKLAGEKAASPAKAAQARPAAKTGHASSTPAKKLAAKKVAPAKAGGKIAAKKATPSRSAAPAKKVVAKAPAKGSASKKAAPPKKTPAKKTALKNAKTTSSIQARGSAGSKHGVKAAKKTVAKSRGRR